MKEMSGFMDKQNNLLKLIVQKMEIKAETELQDEGMNSGSLSPIDTSFQFNHYARRWTSPAVRNTLIRQAAVMAHFQKSIDRP